MTAWTAADTAARSDSGESDRLVTLLTMSLRRMISPEGRRMTQAMLGKHLGVTEQTVSRWFRGETRPSEFNIERLRRTLAWTDVEYSTVCHGKARPERLLQDDIPPWEVLALPPEFPRLRSLQQHVYRPAYLDTTRPPADSVEEDNAFVVGKVRSGQITRAVIANSTQLLTTKLGHGASTIAQIVADRRSAQATQGASLVISHSVESLLGVDSDDLLSEGAANLAALHPLARDGHWNPDDVWVQEQGEIHASKRFEFVTPASARAALERTVADAIVRNLVVRPQIVQPREAYRNLIGFVPDTNADEAESLRALGKHRAAVGSAAFDVRPDLVAFYLSAIEHSPEQLRIHSTKPITRWADLADLCPRLVQEQLGNLSCRLGQLGVRLHGVIDLSPSPIGRTYIRGKGGERLTNSYRNALRIYLAELLSLRDRIVCAFDLTIIAPEPAVEHLPPQLRFDLDNKATHAVREQTDLMPYDTSDLVQMVRARYLQECDTRLIAELSALAHLDDSVAVTTATWLLGQQVADLPSMSKGRSQFWCQEDFDAAIRGLSQMIGLAVSGDTGGHRVAELFLAGLERALPDREDSLA